MKTEESQFISLAAAAKMTNYSQDYISLLCRQGKLKAEKLGRNWVTTKEWVDEYVDKTEGKGASVVPVKIKEADKKENAGEGKAATRPLFGSAILEMAIFCTASVIVLANLVGLYLGVKEIDRNSDLVQQVIDSQNSLSASAIQADGESSADASVDISADAQVCGETTDSLNLLSFDKETDANVIAEVTKKVEGGVTEPVTVEVYKNFAIVSYTNDTAKKSLYMIN